MKDAPSLLKVFRDIVDRKYRLGTPYVIINKTRAAGISFSPNTLALAGSSQQALPESGDNLRSLALPEQLTAFIGHAFAPQCLLQTR
jgi:hypothetical protein